MREVLADLFVARGQTTSSGQALQTLEATETEDDTEDAGENE